MARVPPSEEDFDRLLASSDPLDCALLRAESVSVASDQLRDALVGELRRSAADAPRGRRGRAREDHARARVRRLRRRGGALTAAVVGRRRRRSPEAERAAAGRWARGRAGRDAGLGGGRARSRREHRDAPAGCQPDGNSVRVVKVHGGWPRGGWDRRLGGSLLANGRQGGLVSPERLGPRADYSDRRAVLHGA
jgi:hypothetical protein